MGWAVNDVDGAAKCAQNRNMLLLGLLAFGLNWVIAWGLVRDNPGTFPLAVMTAATTGTTFAMGIVVSGLLVQMGYSGHFAFRESLDAAVYFGLPAAAWASYCASHLNRLDEEETRSLRRF